MSKVTATVRPTDEPAPWEGEHNTRGFRVTLRYDGRRMTVPFWQGSANTEDPTAEDVLYCLVSDAFNADESFEDWCAEYGYTTDSRKAERTYRSVQRQTKSLRRLVGDDFDTLLGQDADVDMEDNIKAFVEGTAQKGAVTL